MVVPLQRAGGCGIDNIDCLDFRTRPQSVCRGDCIAVGAEDGNTSAACMKEDTPHKCVDIACTLQCYNCRKRRFEHRLVCQHLLKDLKRCWLGSVTSHCRLLRRTNPI